jgi:hypothetical protein
LVEGCRAVGGVGLQDGRNIIQALQLVGLFGCQIILSLIEHFLRCAMPKRSLLFTSRGRACESCNIIFEIRTIVRCILLVFAQGCLIGRHGFLTLVFGLFGLRLIQILFRLDCGSLESILPDDCEGILWTVWVQRRSRFSLL